MTLEQFFQPETVDVIQLSKFRQFLENKETCHKKQIPLNSTTYTFVTNVLTQTSPINELDTPDKRRYLLLCENISIYFLCDVIEDNEVIAFIPLLLELRTLYQQYPVLLSDIDINFFHTLVSKCEENVPHLSKPQNMDIAISHLNHIIDLFTDH